MEPRFLLVEVIEELYQMDVDDCSVGEKKLGFEFPYFVVVVELWRMAEFWFFPDTKTRMHVHAWLGSGGGGGGYAQVCFLSKHLTLVIRCQPLNRAE